MRIDAGPSPEGSATRGIRGGQGLRLGDCLRILIGRDWPNPGPETAWALRLTVYPCLSGYGLFERGSGMVAVPISRPPVASLL